MASTELSGSRGSAAASGEPLKKSKRLWWSLCLASRPAKRHRVPCELSRVDKLSSSRIYLPDNLRPRDVREFCRNALSEVFERFKNNIPLLDPIKDMKISDKEFKRSVRKIDNVEEELTNHELHQSETLKDQLATYSQKVEAETEIASLTKQVKELSSSAITRQTLKNMKRVLRRLAFVDSGNVVQLKGRVACDMSTADELLATELMFSGMFNELSPAQIVSLCSTLVNIDRSEEVVRLRPELATPFRTLQESARRIGEVMQDSKIEIEVDEYVDSFRPHMMEIT
eukprot:1112231_1